MDKHDLEELWRRQTGRSLSALTEPLAALQALSHELLHEHRKRVRAIEAAQSTDDPSLPREPGAREPVQTDWSHVRTLCLDSLVAGPCDLRVAATCVEAQLRLHGSAGLGSGFLLLQELVMSTSQAGQTLLPPLQQAGEGRMEHRANVFRALVKRLLPVLRLLPIARHGEAVVSLASVRTAENNEGLRAKPETIELEGPTLESLRAILVQTSDAMFIEVRAGALCALEAGRSLEQTLLSSFDEAPSLVPLLRALEEIVEIASDVLQERGVLTPAVPTEAQPPPEKLDVKTTDMGGSLVAVEAAAAHGLSQPVLDRASAYAQLAHIADFLHHVEPHSPTPYLLRKAVAWGRLSAAELYRELFLENQGQLQVLQLLEAGAAASRGR